MSERALKVQLAADLPIVLEPSWYEALTLRERAVTARKATANGHDAALAGRRAERWRSQAPFTRPEVLAERLVLDGLDEELFLHLLGEPAEALAGRHEGPLPWVEVLSRVYSREWPAGLPPMGSVPAPERAASVGLLRPLVWAGHERLRTALRPLLGGPEPPPFDEGVGHLLLGGLLGHLMLLAGRTVVLELQVARLEDRLPGETPEQRFQSFATQLESAEAGLALLARYPVLARQLVRCLDAWVAFSLDFLGHLAADWKEIRNRFAGGSDPGPLADARTGAGDAHRGGRSVVLLRFAAGQRLVYKPKSLAVEAAFQNLLGWLGERGFEPAFRTLAVLDRGDHGWIEFVEAASCSDDAQVERFYRRQGAFLALLHLLEATDFHHENLIAAGEHPVLIDLETLFHPPVDDPRGELPPVPGHAVADTVLGIGLLPHRTWGGADDPGVDLSGLAARPGQVVSRHVLVPRDAGTDAMRFAPGQVELPAADNLPRLQGEPVSLRPYRGAITAGYAAMHRLLVVEAPGLLAEDGPLARFADAEVRVVMRPTRAYAELHFAALHPHALASALDRDRLLDRLWAAVDRRAFMARLIPFERRDLDEGDVPLFAARPGSRDLWTSRGERLADFFGEAALDRVARRLARWDEEHRERQLWVVASSLELHAIETREAVWSDHAIAPGAAPPAPSELLAAARAVRERLELMAFEDEEGVQWLAPLYRDQAWSLSPAGLDLYHGLPGIALFLAHLAATGDGRAAVLARKAVATMRNQIGQAASEMPELGAFTGWGGVVYVLTHLAVLWRDDALLDEAERIARDVIPPLVAKDEQSDVIGGAAGCILGLLALHAARPSPAALAAAARCGERLLARAQAMPVGLGWMLEIAGKEPLAGMSHGAAGIALALLRLAAATGEDRFREAALAALAYERSLFSPAEQNWPDLREWSGPGPAPHGPGHHFMVAWCHGAAGIALARLGSRDLFDRELRREADEEVAVAVRKTLATGWGKNHSLCHGDLGNLDALLETALRLADRDLAAATGRWAAGVLASIREHGFQHGLTLGVEPPGFMAGLAGIGYELLRLAEPERHPCVLRLAPPGE